MAGYPLVIDQILNQSRGLNFTKYLSGKETLLIQRFSVIFNAFDKDIPIFIGNGDCMPKNIRTNPARLEELIDEFDSNSDLRASPNIDCEVVDDLDEGSASDVLSWRDDEEHISSKNIQLFISRGVSDVCLESLALDSTTRTYLPSNPLPGSAAAAATTNDECTKTIKTTNIKTADNSSRNTKKEHHQCRIM